MKKIIALILVVVLSVGVLSSCALFTHNAEEDLKQVVAIINPITVDGVKKTIGVDGKPVLDNMGNPITTPAQYVSEEKKIYKVELYNRFRDQSTELVTNQGMTVEQAYNYCLDELIVRQLIIIEADRRVFFNDIYVDMTDQAVDFTAQNEISRGIFDQLDTELTAKINETLTNHDEEPRPTPEETTTDTTYPIFTPDYEQDKVVSHTKWVPSVTRYPASRPTDTADSVLNQINKDNNSADREGMRRLIDTIVTNCKEDFRATASDKAEFEKDKAKFNELIAQNKYGELYVYLGGCFSIDWLIGKNVANQVKVNMLQESIVDEVAVTAADIGEYYESVSTSQKTSFDADPAAYDKAITDKELILYTPNNEYNYVRHILLPFTEAQTALLTNYGKQGGISKEQVKEYRAQLASSLVIYPHVNGEDDKTNPTNINTVYNEIKGTIEPLLSDPYASEIEFNNLIYKYNTDPGIFESPDGYAVGAKPDEAAGEQETYMVEFAEGARKLAVEGILGAISQPILTDYGYHILYLTKMTTAQTTYTLTDKLTRGSTKTYYQIIEDKIKTEREKNQFSQWQGERISYYENVATNTIVRYKDRFKNLIE